MSQSANSSASSGPPAAENPPICASSQGSIHSPPARSGSGPAPTRAKVLAALDGLKNFDLGGLEVSYSPQDHTGIDYADLSIISEGRFRR